MSDQLREDKGAEVVECERCEGRGWSTASTYKSGRPSKQRESCPSCAGSGSVPAPRLVGSGVINVVEALRRGAERPQTAQGWVHAGPGLLEEAADRIERLEATLPSESIEAAPLVEDGQEGLRERLTRAILTAHDALMPAFQESKSADVSVVRTAFSALNAALSTPQSVTPEADSEVTVVTSGHPEPIKLKAHEKVHQLIRDGLTAAGIPSADIVGWTLRFKDGSEIPNGERIGEAGVKAGDTLFLDPEAGGGASGVSQSTEPPKNAPNGAESDRNDASEAASDTSLEEQLAEALKQRDRDYKRFSEAKQGVIASDSARIKAEDERDSLTAALKGEIERLRVEHQRGYDSMRRARDIEGSDLNASTFAAVGAKCAVIAGSLESLLSRRPVVDPPAEESRSGGRSLDENGVNEFGVAMCECGNKPVHAWEPGEWCGDRVIPTRPKPEATDA